MANDQNVINDETRLGDGSLPQYAFPGGYTILYGTRENDILCAQCAHKDEDAVEWTDLYYEGEPVNCADCNKVLESSYGVPDDDARNDGAPTTTCNDCGSAHGPNGACGGGF